MKLSTDLSSHNSLISQVATLNDWIELPKKEAYYGLAGDIVHNIEPNSEADPVALLIQLLTCFGNVVDNKPHFRVEEDKHSLKIYPVLVGQTAKARKGTSLSRIKSLFSNVDKKWADEQILTGLSSGEGLIAAADSIDKRILIIESEFASTLKVMGREGNILSPIIRQAWDSCDLRNLTKNNPLRASNTHITIVGHITEEELHKYLTQTEMANGFGNRFLWLCVRRSKLLPEGGDPSSETLIPLIQRLKASMEFASKVDEIKRNEEATKLWIELYPKLSEEKLGMIGALTARGEPYVMRLASIYALLDCSNFIRPEHLRAALAVWNYSEASVKYIFGDSLGNHTADTIRRKLEEAYPNSLSRTAISKIFSNHHKRSDIDEALNLLKNRGIALVISNKGDGRPEESWIIAKKAK